MKEAKKSKKMILVAMTVLAMVCVSAMPALSFTEKTANNTMGNNHTIYAIDKPLSKAGTLGNGNVLISTDNPSNDDVHPQVAMSSGGVPVVVYERVESILQKTVPICYSTDDGATWTMAFNIDSTDLQGSGVLEYPAIAYNPTLDGLFFAATDPSSDYPSFFGWIKGDIASASQMDYLNAFSKENPVENAVTCNGQWMIWLDIEDYSAASVVQAPALMYLTYDSKDQTFKFPSDINSDWIAGSYYDGQSVTVTSPASNPSIDAGSSRMYFVIQHDNETTGRSEVVYKETLADMSQVLTNVGNGRGGMDKYADVEIWPWQGVLVGSSLHDYKDPDVATSGSTAVVVYQTNDNIYGDYDIHCTYTNDDGQTWQTSVVAENHPADDTNPAVYMSGNTAYCVYVSSGNLYLVKSEDGGATWGAPEQINDQDGTVVAEDGTADINAGGIVWTDNRNGAKDIYYSPLPAPRVGVKAISGGMGIKATIDNTGTVDASNVDWSIKLSGLIFMGKEATGSIDTLAAGAETTISSGLVFGIGPTTITVTAAGTSRTASGFVLGPMVLGVK